MGLSNEEDCETQRKDLSHKFKLIFYPVLCLNALNEETPTRELDNFLVIWKFLVLAHHLRSPLHRPLHSNAFPVLRSRTTLSWPGCLTHLAEPLL